MPGSRLIRARGASAKGMFSLSIGLGSRSWTMLTASESEAKTFSADGSCSGWLRPLLNGTGVAIKLLTFAISIEGFF